MKITERYKTKRAQTLLCTVFIGVQDLLRISIGLLKQLKHAFYKAVAIIFITEYFQQITLPGVRQNKIIK